MLVKELKVCSKPLNRYYQNERTGTMSLTLCSRPRIALTKTGKRFRLFGAPVERRIYKKVRAYKLALTCDPPEELSVALAKIEAAAKRYDLPLQRNFLVTPADLKIFTKEWKLWSTLGYGGDEEEPEAATTAVMTIQGIIRSEGVREEFLRHAIAIAEPEKVHAGYQTISFLTGEAVVAEQPHLHLMQMWPEFDEDRVMRFCTSVLTVAKTHRAALGIWDNVFNEETRRKRRLPPYLNLHGSFVGEQQASGFYRTFHFAYFHI